MTDSLDFFKKFQPLFEAKAPVNDKIQDEKEKQEFKKSEAKKPANVKESGADFFRKYSDIIKEAEENKACKTCDKAPCVCEEDKDKKDKK